MSIRVMTQVWDKATHLSGGTLLVLLALADWADDSGRCWPSIDKIAKKSRLTDRQVQNILALLVAQEIITVQRGSGRGKVSQYQIKGEKLSPFIEPGKGEIWGTKRVKSATEKGEICDIPLIEPSGTVNGTVNLPSPTPSEKSEGVRVPDPVDVEIETDRVMRECSFVDQRVRSAISRAMDMHLARGDLDAEATANLMIGNWQEYQRLGEYMRFVWGPAKFFAQGHWVNWELWPIDRERLHRAKEARVGT